MANKLNIAIAGATGFVGLELIKKIYVHPSVEIKYLFVKDSIDENIYDHVWSENQIVMCCTKSLMISQQKL